MKRLIFIFFAVLFSSLPSLAQTGDDAVPASWLKGINPRTGKQVKLFLGKPMYLLEPEALKTNADGTSTFSFSKVSASSMYKRVRTWNLSTEAQNLINYAINHHQWLSFVYNNKKNEDMLENISSVLSLSLLPYSFESEDSVGGAVPETEDPEWVKEGVTFSDDIKGDTITKAQTFPMLALKSGNAYLMMAGADIFVTDSFRGCLYHIDNVPASALPFLRFIIKNNAVVFVTYDKSTLKVYKIRLYSGWNETLIIGKDATENTAQHALTFKLSDVGNDSLTIELLDKYSFHDVVKRERVKAINGQFFYDLKTDLARYICVWSKTGHLYAWVVPGEHGIVTGTMKKHVWSGTEFYTELEKVEKAKAPFWKQMQQMCDDVNNKKITDKEAYAQMDIIDAKMDSVNLAYIKKHPDSGLSVVLCGTSSKPMEKLNMINPKTIIGPFSNYAMMLAADDFYAKMCEKASK